MKTWAPLNCKTHFSLLKGFCRCNILAAKCKEYGYAACGIADIGTISGAVDFHQSCKKEGIKPILGCDFGDFILYAKNKDGWFDLIKYVSTQDVDTLKLIAEHGNVICVSSDANGLQKLFKNNHIDWSYRDHEVFYVDREDAECHRVMLCSGMKTNLKKVAKKIKDQEELENEKFFLKDDWYLPTPEESKEFDDSQVLNKIIDMCEDYELNEKPMLPHYDCPQGLSEDEYLKDLCRHGWRNRLMSSGKIDSQEAKDIYTKRIKQEMDVIFKAELSGYFLIVRDIVTHVKDQGWIAGPGRGSAAGCLVSYLLNITEVDPIEYDLIFERFYNEGRNTEDYISLPDIDVDVPSEHRDDIIAYIKEKYGQDNVAQMITFGRLQGRSAVKEVLRINEAVSFAEMNDITDSIPDEAQISDQLEMMEDPSIIKWALINEADNLREWCYMDEEENINGPLADLFKQAIKIEGTNKSQGKHAAGVIISKHKLQDICPMVLDKSGKPIAAFEMNDLESQGHVKFDILGIDLLSKIMDIIASED